MLPGFMGGQMGVLQPNANLIEVIRTLGVEANLRLCLDFGDAASWPGSGQLWKDRSGGAYDFNFGTTTGVEASDPTANGVAGRQSSAEYGSVNGSQWWTLGQANPSWLQQAHKTGAIITFAGWVYVNNITSTAQALFDVGDQDASGFNGFGIGQSGSVVRAVGFGISNASGTVYGLRSTALATNNAWNFLAVSVDMGAGTVIIQINGTTETNTSQTFTGTPISGNAGGTLQVGARGSGIFADSTGCRWAAGAMWSIALTGTQLASIFAATRAKFGV